MRGIIDEELLEPIARLVRFNNIINEINSTREIVIIDLGCGPNCYFLEYAKKKGLKIRKYIGIDPLVSVATIKRYKNVKWVEIINQPMNKKIPLNNGIADYIIGSAFIEHISFPREVLNDCVRLLRKKGKIIFTTPTLKAKSILELLSYRLGLISRREIEEHKNYFDAEKLKLLLQKSRNVEFCHRYFEYGLNNLFTIKKTR